MTAATTIATTIATNNQQCSSNSNGNGNSNSNGNGNGNSNSNSNGNSNGNSNSNSYWPTATDNNIVKLHMPMQWKLSPDNESTCTIQYDATRQLLKIVDEQHSIIDIINPMDIIGVAVEIKLYDSKTGTEFKGVKGASFSDERLNESVTNHDETTPRSPSEPNNTSYNATATTTGCHIFDTVTSDEGALDTNDLIPVNSQATAVLNIYSYPKSNSATQNSWFSRSTNPYQPQPNYNADAATGPRRAHPYSFPVTAAHDFENLTQLVKAIRSVALLPPTKPKYLVVINPQSGTGLAPTVWQNTVQPMLEQEAGIDVTVVTTDYAGHARDLMANSGDGAIDLLQYDAVICLGGDGVLHELLQGWQARSDLALILQTVCLGVLGCGTGNGLAKSLTFEANEQWSTLESTFLIARGQTMWIDLSKYVVQDKTYTSFLTFTWAMIADIDIDSECIRFLGSARMDVWGARCIVGMRKYRGRLSYLPPPEKGAATTTAATTVAAIMPALTEPVPADWKVIDDDILLLWASQVPYAAQTNYNSPPSSLQDGVFQILLVRGKHVGRIAMASILLGLDHGSHATHPAAEFIECVAYRLEPLTEGSHNDLDGEAIESGPVQAHVLPGALRVFGTSKRNKKEVS